MFASALSQTARAVARPSAARLFSRTLASGPAQGGEISDELLVKLGSLSTQALVDGLWVMGWPPAQIDNVRPLHKSHKCVGRAVTLQFVPVRPDIAADKPAGGESPEYEAFEKCGPNEVRFAFPGKLRPMGNTNTFNIFVRCIIHNLFVFYIAM